MANSKAVMERNIHAYDENREWQLPEPGALTSAKAYWDKNALPLVERLKTVVKNLTVKCVQLMEQVKKLTDKTERQASDIKWYKGKLKEQTGIIEQLQEKAADLERIKRYAGVDKVQGVIDSMKEVERIDEEQRRLQRSYNRSIGR